MQKLTFSGHETFTCKQFWLKKGYDFLKKNKKFSSADAVVDLGVGKNMVGAIKYWLKSFGLVDDKDYLNDIAEYILGENGKDKYLEDIGTVWLLHYFLVKSNKASIFNLVFNEFRYSKIEFSKEQLHNFLKTKCEENNSNYNENTVNNDIKVFIRSYIRSKDSKTEIEDEISGLLYELHLVEQHKNKNSELGNPNDVFKIENKIRVDLPPQIILFAILDNENYSNSIAINDLQYAQNSIGRIFAINRDNLISKIQELTYLYPNINYSETAGNQILQFKNKLDKWEILDDYYV